MNICRMAAVTGAAGIALIATGVAGGAGMAPAGHSSSAAASYRLDAMAGPATRNAGQHTAREEWAGFTVSGSIPVPTAAQGNQSQDTWVKGLICNPAEEKSDRGDGAATELFMRLHGAPEAASLLGHFLGGSGTAISYPDGSAISDDLKKDPAFKALNTAVISQIVSELSKGNLNIMLKEPPLKTIVLGDASNELYYGFRGTQGLLVNGSGSVHGSRYSGTVTYVIQDSYGFTQSDTFYGIGTEMRYLQANCGTPPAPGGARWFPDSLTATMSFTSPCGCGMTSNQRRTAIRSQRGVAIRSWQR